MKKSLLLLILLLSLNCFSQQASKVNNAQNVWTVNHDPAVLLECDPAVSGLFRPRIKDSIYWETYNINGLETFVNNKGDVRYKSISYTPSNSEVISAIGYTPYSNTNPNGYISSFTEVDPSVPPYSKSLTSFNIIKTDTDLLYPSLTGSYVNPAWIVSLPYTKITGAPSIPAAQVNSDWNAVSGVAQILNKPVIPTDNNQLTNGSGYITASSTNTLTNKSGNISQWTNNSGYLTSVPAQSFASLTGKPSTIAGYGITDFSSLFDTNFATKTTTNLIEGSNLYYTAARFNTAFSGKSTTDLVEGTNLYYTATRFNTAFATKSTTDLAEGTNLYFTNARARSAISLTTTGTGVATYSSGTGVLNIPTPLTTTDNIATRTINSSTYTISSTRIATVRYNIKISCTASIGSNSLGRVNFQYSIDGGTNWIDAGEVENSNTVTLAIALNSVTTQTGFITWNVPANALCRLVPTSTGTTTITWIRGQETY